MKTFISFAIVVSCLLSACGGGGGGAAPTTPPIAATPIAVQATSYLNAKNVGFGQSKIAPDLLAFAFSDFKRNGEYQLFAATLAYDVKNPSTFSTKGTFGFYTKQSDGTYKLDSTLLAANTGCFHPRKAIVADFNQDGRPDVFVACHGIDVAPFAGEKSAFVMSKSDGTYSTSWLNFDAFGHGASAGDLNGDGYPDIVLADSTVSYSPLVLINNKDGTFTKRTDLLPSALKFKQIYSIELIDFNKDGKLDLWFAGHDWDDGGHTQIAPSIYLSNGTSDFSTITATVLPVIANEGVTLDVLFDTGNIYMLRTSGGDGTFYLSTVIQKVTYPALASSVIYNSNRISNNGYPWTPWMVMVGGKLIAAYDKFSFSVTP
jgi:hypothetical protein